VGFVEWSKQLDNRFMGPVRRADIPLPDLGRQADESRLGYLVRLYLYAASHSRGFFAPRLFVLGHVVPGSVLGGLLAYCVSLGGPSAQSVGRGAFIGGMLGLATGTVVIVWGYRQHRAAP
jgi:hypothetical protein